MGIFKDIGKISVKGIGKIFEGVGAGTIGLAKQIPKVGKAIGTPTAHFFNKSPGEFLGAMAVGTLAGTAAANAFGEDKVDAAKTGAIGGFAAASLGGAGAINALGAAAVGNAAVGVAAVAGLGKKMIKMPDAKVGKLGVHNFSEIKLSKAGGLMIAAGLALATPLKMENEYEKIHMGTNDGRMRTATPIIPFQQNGQAIQGGNIDYSNTGATGDLVFAMHNNR